MEINGTARHTSRQGWRAITTVNATRVFHAAMPGPFRGVDCSQNTAGAAPAGGRDGMQHADGFKRAPVATITRRNCPWDPVSMLAGFRQSAARMDGPAALS